MAPEGVKPRISEFFPELLRSWREVTRKYPNSRHDWTAALSFIFPFGRSIKKLSIRIPFASDSSWWPATARQLTQSLESSSLVASISDFLCRSSPRSSGRHAYLHCTYFLNVENVAGVVGKANNRVTVTTCLLTRDKWQKQEKKRKKKKERKERRRRRRERGKKYRRMHRKRAKGGGGSWEGKSTKGEDENTEEGSWWWKERGRTRERSKDSKRSTAFRVEPF